MSLSEFKSGPIPTIVSGQYLHNLICCIEANFNSVNSQILNINNGGGQDQFVIVTDNNDGTYTVVNVDGSVITIDVTFNENLTSLTDNNNGTITYIDENGNPTTIQLCKVLEDMLANVPMNCALLVP